MTVPPDESCWRVPIDHSEFVEQWVGDSRSGRRHGFIRLRKKSNKAAWAPIVSAVDAAGARAKIEELYPEAKVGQPVRVCKRGKHSDKAQYLRHDRLVSIGFT